LLEGFRGRGAVVGPTLGWRQVPEAVRLAELTAQLIAHRAGADPTPADPVFADDHLTTLALRGEPGALAVLSARRLAPLAPLRSAARQRLLETLNSWLRHWGSRADVAAELYIHPQTVSYRLKRLRELLGDDLDDPTARFELLLALANPTELQEPD
jgi:DNA-binding PucR family transcriptional regulator